MSAPDPWKRIIVPYHVKLMVREEMFLFKRFKVSIKRFVLIFGLWEVVSFLVGVGLGVDLFIGIFFLSLIGVPLMVFPFVLQANTRTDDEQFESPALWIALAVLAFLAGVGALSAGVVAGLRGEYDGLLTCILISVLPFGGSIWLVMAASARFVQYRTMKLSNRAKCPVCGAKGPREFDMCLSCGAIVFWVPETEEVRPRRDRLDELLLSQRY